MRYLSTLLLSTTFLTATATYAAVTPEIDDSTATVVAATPISPATLAKIEALRTLVTHTSDFNISDASGILFTPELLPFISWRSATRDETVIDHIKQIMREVYEREYNRNSKLLSYVLFSIIFQDHLEEVNTGSYHKSTDIKEPTCLNTLIDGTICWGWYRNVLSHYKLTLTPEIRLKLYLELLQQTNITPDSLGHILRTTSELRKMFLTEPRTAFVDSISRVKEDKAISLSSDAAYHYFSPTLQYPSLAGIHTETATPEQILNELTWRFKDLSRTLSGFDRRLDESFATTNEIIDRILTSFGSHAVTLFSEIFERIATHALTKPEDKITAAGLLFQANGSQEVLVRVYYGLANDSTRDIKDRITNIRKLVEFKAMPQASEAATVIANDSTIKIPDRLSSAKILLETGSNDTAISAYMEIMKTVKSSALEVEEETSHLLKIGVALHKAGDVNVAIEVLLQSLKALIIKVKTGNASISINTLDFIAATEIVFNAGKIRQKDNAIRLISWAVYHTLTGAFLQEAIILGAEVAQRMGDLTASREFLDHLQHFEAYGEFKDRAAALEAKLATAQSTQ